MSKRKYLGIVDEVLSIVKNIIPSKQDQMEDVGTQHVEDKWGELNTPKEENNSILTIICASGVKNKPDGIDVEEYLVNAINNNVPISEIVEIDPTHDTIVSIGIYSNGYDKLSDVTISGNDLIISNPEAVNEHINDENLNYEYEWDKGEYDIGDGFNFNEPISPKDKVTFCMVGGAVLLIIYKENGEKHITYSR